MARRKLNEKALLVEFSFRRLHLSPQHIQLLKGGLANNLPLEPSFSYDSP